MAMKQEFLGKGCAFPFSIDARGGIATSEGAGKIEQSIKIILGTEKGERVMLPEFGCDIHTFLFASMNMSTQTMIKSAVRDALVQWEPRVEVINVKILSDKLAEGVLLIDLMYKVRATNTERNLVYPFHFEPRG